VEKELENSPHGAYLSTNSGEDSDAMPGRAARPRGRARNRKKYTKKKSTPSIDGRVAKVSSIAVFS
jgi:hypothetical protein